MLATQAKVFEQEFENELLEAEEYTRLVRKKTKITLQDESEICFYFGKIAAFRTIQRKRLDSSQAADRSYALHEEREKRHNEIKLAYDSPTVSREQLRQMWEDYHYISGQMIAYKTASVILEKKEEVQRIFR